METSLPANKYSELEGWKDNNTDQNFTNVDGGGGLGDFLHVAPLEILCCIPPVLAVSRPAEVLGAAVLLPADLARGPDSVVPREGDRQLRPADRHLVQVVPRHAGVTRRRELDQSLQVLFVFTDDPDPFNIAIE